MSEFTTNYRDLIEELRKLRDAANTPAERTRVAIRIEDLRDAWDDLIELTMRNDIPKYTEASKKLKEARDAVKQARREIDQVAERLAKVDAAAKALVSLAKALI